MTNHIHLLVLPRNADGMINFMKLLAQRYTQYYNRKYERSGKLWENRYKIHPVDPELYYVLLKYIEMNPVRMGLVSDGTAYPWSSAPYHISGKSNPTVLADCLHNSIFRYRDFFYEKEDLQVLDGIRINAQQGKAWGRPLFLEKLEKSLGRIVTPRRRGRPKKEKE